MKFAAPPIVLSFILFSFFSFFAESSTEGDMVSQLSVYVSLGKEVAQNYKKTFAEEPNCENPSSEETKGLLVRLNQEDNIYGKSSLDEVAKQLSWDRTEFLKKEIELFGKQGDRLGESLENWYSGLKWHHFYWWATHSSCSRNLNSLYFTVGSLNNLLSASQNFVSMNCVKNSVSIDKKTKELEESIVAKVEKLTNILAFLEPLIDRCINDPK